MIYVSLNFLQSGRIQHPIGGLGTRDVLNVQEAKSSRYLKRNKNDKDIKHSCCHASGRYVFYVSNFVLYWLLEL